MRTFVRVCVCVCAHACVYERGRERERELCVCVCACVCVCVCARVHSRHVCILYFMQETTHNLLLLSLLIYVPFCDREWNSLFAIS